MAFLGGIFPGADGGIACATHGVLNATLGAHITIALIPEGVCLGGWQGETGSGKDEGMNAIHQELSVAKGCDRQTTPTE